MEFTIVKERKTSQCCVVPGNWLSVDRTKTFWPKKDIKIHQRNKYSLPDETFYPTETKELKGGFSTFVEADAALELYIRMSGIEDSDEEERLAAINDNNSREIRASMRSKTRNKVPPEIVIPLPSSELPVRQAQNNKYIFNSNPFVF